MVRPRLLEIMKYSPPVPRGLLVATADALRAVIKAIALQIRTIAIVPISPAWATTQPNLRYIITPRMVRTLGVKTPRKAPNLGLVSPDENMLSLSAIIRAQTIEFVTQRQILRYNECLL